MISTKFKIGNAIWKLYCVYLVLTECFANSQSFRLISIGVLALMFILYGIQFLKYRRVSLFSAPGIYAIFVIFALSSCLWAVSIERSKAVMYELITSLLFIIIITENINTPERLNKYIDGFLFSIACMCVLLLFGCRLDIMSLRDLGTDIIGLDKNYFSQLCAFAIIISFYRYRLERKKINLLNIFLCFIVIIGSGSRKAFLSIGLGFVFMYGFAYRHNLKKLLNYIIAFCVVIVIIAICLSRINPEFLTDISDGILVFFMDDSSASDTSATIRTALIERAMELFSENPILGLGLNNFSYYSSDINIYGGYMYAHNNYAELLADFGLVGFLIYYSAYGLYFYKLAKGGSKNNNRFSIALSFSVIVLLLINDIASVSYYLKMYPFLMMIAYKVITVGVSQFGKN